MRRRREEPLGSLVRQFLRNVGLETPLNEHRAVEAWPQVAGPVATRYTQQVFFKHGILYVKLSSAALRENLSHQRTEFAKRINEVVGAQVVSEVRFC